MYRYMKIEKNKKSNTKLKWEKKTTLISDEKLEVSQSFNLHHSGRKKSYLHRVHSLCAEPFLATLPKPDNLIDESTSILSPSSHSALIHMVDEHMDRQGGDIASKWRGDGLSKQTGTAECESEPESEPECGFESRL